MTNTADSCQGNLMHEWFNVTIKIYLFRVPKNQIHVHVQSFFTMWHTSSSLLHRSQVDDLVLVEEPKSFPYTVIYSFDLHFSKHYIFDLCFLINSLQTLLRGYEFEYNGDVG